MQSTAVVAARLTVQVSLLLAVAVGCWLMARAEPGAALAALLTFIAAAVAARRWLDSASGVVLFLAYTSTGLLVGLGYGSSVPVWLAALAGLATGFSWTRWHAPARWHWPLMLWLLGIAISWPLIAARESDFGAPSPDDATAIVVFNAVASISAALWLDAGLSWDRRTIERRVARPLLASALVSAAAALYQGLVDISWMSDEPWVSAGRAIGLLADANPMAIAAAIWAPLAVVLVRGRRLIRAIACAALWLAAWLTGARTVLLLIPAGAIGLIGGSLVERRVPTRGLVRALAIGAAVGAAAVALTVTMPAPRSGPTARLARSLPLQRPGELLYEAFWRRDGYGGAAVRAIREHPLSGIGNGAFVPLSRYFYRLEYGIPAPADNAQNLWRQALAERGLLALPAVVALTALTIQLLWQRHSGVSSMYARSLKAVIVGLGLTLTFGLPTQNPALAVTAASLVAWLHAVVQPRDAGAAPGSVVVGLVWSLAVAGAVVDLGAARAELRPPMRAARLGDPYLRGFGELEDGPRGLRGRVVRDYAVVALNPTGPRYQLRCWTRGDEPRRLRVRLDRRVVIDEAIPSGVVVERLIALEMARRGIVLELETDAPGIVIAGDFVN